jgi:putative hydrolase of the HAD superfamily
LDTVVGVVIVLELVSFDVWNTLLDLKAMYRAVAAEISGMEGLKLEEVYEAILEEHAHAKSLKASGALPGDNTLIDRASELLIRRLGIGRSSLEEAVHRAMRKIDYQDVVIDGALEALTYANRRGLIVVLLGNVLFWTSDVTRELLKRAGLLNQVKATYFADEMGIQKPSREAFHRPLKDFGLRPEDAIHVGDSITEDFGGALAAGLSAALITPDVLQPMTVNRRIHFIPSVKHFPTVLDKLMSQGYV